VIVEIEIERVGVGSLFGGRSALLSEPRR
jgi:hypothetical protein